MTEPLIPVDFGNRDSDGAVRLVTTGAMEAIAAIGLKLDEGLQIRLTDGELHAFGKASFRDGMWVVILLTGIE